MHEYVKSIVIYKANDMYEFICYVKSGTGHKTKVAQFYVPVALLEYFFKENPEVFEKGKKKEEEKEEEKKEKVMGTMVI